MTKKTIITCALIGAILAGTTLTGFVGWYSAEKKKCIGADDCFYGRLVW